MIRKYPIVPDATEQAIVLLEQALDLFDPANIDAFWHREALERALTHLDELGSFANLSD